MEIQKHNTLSTQLIDLFKGKAFNAFDNEIVVAMQYPSIMNMPPDGIDSLKNKLLILIGKTHALCGFPVDEMQIQFTIDDFVSDLKKETRTLSFAEIEIAFKNGYKEIYGKFYGLNNKTYFQWVNGYFYAENRLRVKKLLLDAKENQNKEPIKLSEQEIKEQMKAGILKSFDNFKKGAIILDAGNVQYNFLVNHGLLNFTKERKTEILGQVKLRLKTEAVENKNRTESISSALSKIFPETEISEAKKDSLKIYFSELVKMEIEISDLLDGL